MDWEEEEEEAQIVNAAAAAAAADLVPVVEAVRVNEDDDDDIIINDRFNDDINIIGQANNNMFGIDGEPHNNNNNGIFFGNHNNLAIAQVRPIHNHHRHGRNNNVRIHDINNEDNGNDNNENNNNGNMNNNDNNNNNNINVNDDDDIQMAPQIMIGNVNIPEARRHNVSSFLFESIREQEYVCSSVLSSGSTWMRNKSCHQLVAQCTNFPEEAYHVSVLFNGRSTLHEACLRGSCIHVIQALTQANPLAPFDRDNQGNTPLHLLFVDYSTQNIMNPQSIDQIVQELLQFNPQFLATATNLDGSTPLHMACKSPETMIHINSLQQLLSANSACVSKLNSRNQTPLRLHCERRSASVQVAQLLVQAFPDALRILDFDDGWAPLHYAAYNLNIPLIQYLVQQHYQYHQRHRHQQQQLQQQHIMARNDIGPLQVYTNPNEETALHLMCRKGIPFTQTHIPAIQSIVQVFPESIIQKDNNRQYTPLHILCREPRHCKEVYQLLVETNPQVVTIPDKDNKLPLHYAAEFGLDTSIIEYLLQMHPAAARAVTKKQDTALSLACSCNKSVDTVRALILANKSALMKQNDYGYTPLHCVCRAYQPRMAIVQALLDAGQSSIALKTHCGETPVHIACNNTGAFVGVLQLLTAAQNAVNTASSSNNISLSGSSRHQRQQQQKQKQQGRQQQSISTSNITTTATTKSIGLMTDRRMTNKVGNTPLHNACFHGSSFEHIETLALANPEWVLAPNNGGYTPLQILCKNGHVDERIVTTFSRIGGPETFSIVDSIGNTPLHSAMREETNIETLNCLITAFPDALHRKTTYGNSPLHLACFRRTKPNIIRQVAMMASCKSGSGGGSGSGGSSSKDGNSSSLSFSTNNNNNSSTSLVLEPNMAGQTPIGIAMEEFRSICRGGGFCCVKSEYTPEQQRAFDVLATLVKILYYGNQYYYHQEDHFPLVRACVSLHRQDVRLDPAFIRRAIHVYPEEAQLPDEHGNYPLHIEASTPIEKMALLDGSHSSGGGGGCCRGKCHLRSGVLRMLLELFPGATSYRNTAGEFPLGLMIRNGRVWGPTIALALKAFPPALHWYEGLMVDSKYLWAMIIEKVSDECGIDTLYALIKSRPDNFSRLEVVVNTTTTILSQQEQERDVLYY